MRVEVADGKFEKAFRMFKKKIEDSGLLKELMKREFYLKPTAARKRKKAAAAKRWQKYVSSNKLPERKY